MLSSQLRGAARIGAKNARFFSAQAAAKYNIVKFQQEDIQSVIHEVPDVPFYLVGNPSTDAYPYTETEVSENILRGDIHNQPPKAEWKISQLENGVKVVSIDKSGVTSKIGLYVNAGSRHETAETAGAAHFTELLAYRSTAHLSYLRQMKTAEAFSGELNVDAGREFIGYTAEGNRHYLPHLVTLATGNAIFPRLLRWEVEDVKPRVDIVQNRLEKTPAFLVQELLHEAAFYNNSLGNARYSARKNPNFKNTVIKDFITSRYEPKNMTLVGVNVDHNEFAKWAARSFVDYTTLKTSVPTTPAKYTGGVTTRALDGAKSTQIAVAYKMGGSSSKDATIAAIVKAALGGAHITGTIAGPTTSRIAAAFKNAKDAEVIFHSYSDAGIWGLRVEVEPKETKAAIEQIGAYFKGLSAFTEADWTRAKAIVKGEIAASTETVDGQLHFAARQLIAGDAFVTPAQAIANVDKITAAEVATFVKSLSEPSVAIAGQTKYAPHADEIKAALRK